MKKVIVIGSPGAGKSTFSRLLAQKTGLPLYHLDKIYWRADWQNISKEEFDASLSDIMKGEEWITDGNYKRTLSDRLHECDTVFYLDLPRMVCIGGYLSRLRKNRGISRPDMGENCVERFDREFVKYIWDFNTKQRPKIHEMLKETKADIHIFHSRKEAKKFLDGMEKS